jgi:SAM-dependent methyltransferase
MQIVKSKNLKINWWLIYLFKRIFIRLFGTTTTLRFFLRLHWLLRRTTFEIAAKKFGDQFQNLALGLSEELLESIIEPGNTIADLGCGTGRWSRICAKHAQKVFGIDTNGKALEEAVALGGGVDYLKLDLGGDLSQMPQVDLAIMIHFLEHIENPAFLLKSLREKAKRIIVEVPDFESDPLNYPRFWMAEPFYYDADHFQEFTLSELILLLNKTGWKIDQVSQKGGTLLIIAST